MTPQQKFVLLFWIIFWLLYIFDPAGNSSENDQPSAKTLLDAQLNESWAIGNLTEKEWRERGGPSLFSEISSRLDKLFDTSHHPQPPVFYQNTTGQFR
ncbi:hypothetical protein HK102_009633, partial [Quaeritorhiza haematococci]